MKNTGTLTVTAVGDREIVMTRVFDAPRHLVFEAFTKPELLRRWFGPRGFSLVVCDVDYRVGGGFRFVLRGPGGREMGMRGGYLEIVPTERPIHMESFDDQPGEAQVTAVFAEEGGRTTLTQTVLSPSREIRDAVLKSAWSTARPRPTTGWPNFWRKDDAVSAPLPSRLGYVMARVTRSHGLPDGADHAMARVTRWR